MDDPTEWLEQKGFPIRGIISGRGSPTERLAGFVDHFLQPGMAQLPTFLKDTKHTLQILENMNQEKENGELSRKRYIDDVLGLFKGNQNQFSEFVDWLNSIMKGIVKFKSNYSSEKVEFLDLIISIENGKLKTNLFIKPTNLQLYFRSNHPKHCKIGIIYGQALRIIERCSDPVDANLHLEKLKEKLLTRHYPENAIDQQFSRAKKNDRKELIYQNRKQKNKNDKKTRLIFTHNEGNPPLHQWLREAKKLLVRNERAKSMGEDMQISFRQPRNLKKIATGSSNVGRGELTLKLVAQSVKNVMHAKF